MKVLGIIPARYASSRFPGKPLTVIRGKSMIRNVYERVHESALYERIIIATDDKRIAEHAMEFGAEVMMTREDHQSGTDRCGEVMNSISGNYDVIINIQGDEPFIQMEQFQKVISAFQDSSTEIATLAKSISSMQEIQDPNIVKVVFSKDHRALYFSRSAIPFARNSTKYYFKHIGVYAFRPAILKQVVLLQPTELEKAESLEQLRWLENGFKITVVETDFESISIDTPEDLEKVK